MVGSFIVGNGRGLKFWNDLGAGRCPCVPRFPPCLLLLILRMPR